MHALHGTKPNRTKPNHFICPTLALTLHSQCGCCKFRFFSMFRFLFDAQAVDVGIYRYGRLLFYTRNFSILIVYCIVLCWTEVWSWNMRLCKAPLMWYCGRYIERTHQLLSFRWFLYSFAVINGKLWTIQSSYNQRLPHSGGMTMLQLRLTFAFYQSGKSTRYSRPTG